ncbi:MAG: V-type ATP synthase subunit K [Firmicutes bacterium]|nr:V-type ATP synthase subunit K [Bacillota bacterium]
MDGNLIALLGAALAIIATGVASAIGMSWVQRAAAGVVTEDPEKYGKTMILQLIPSSAGLYGFVVGFLVLINVFMGDGAAYTTSQGLLILIACLPIAIVGVVATIFQAKVCVAGIQMLSKREELSGRAIVMSVFIELFTLFGLIASILAVLQVTPGA